MAWTQSQLDALEEAIAHGTLEVQYTDKRIRYRSLGEMLRLRDMMRRELGLLTGQGNRIVMDYKSGKQTTDSSFDDND